MQSRPEMTALALIELLRLLEEAGIAAWLDGGRGVDALLERQTRPHKDLDLVVAVGDMPELIAVLSARGLRVEEGAPRHSFVLADGAGLEVDVHAVTFDKHGNGLYRMESGGTWIFPAEGFAGRGRVGDMQVRCLSPTVHVLCYGQGYEPAEKDFRDMELLAEHFSLELPPQLCRPIPGDASA